MSVEENKRIARLYHELNPDDIETIHAPAFIGHGDKGLTWNRDDHKKTWLIHHANLKDTIHVLVAEGDMVAIRFNRSGVLEGKQVSSEIMQFIQFANGRITEIWESYDTE